MKTFQFYILDDRYSVPTLLFVEAETLARARVIAANELLRPHHSSVEVFIGDRRLFQVSGRPVGPIGNA